MASNDFPCGYIVEIYVWAERKREKWERNTFFVQTKRRWYPWLGKYSLENAYNLFDQKKWALFFSFTKQVCFYVNISVSDW